MPQSGKEPILNGVLQSDLDAAGFSITNLIGLGAGTVSTVTGDNGSNVGLTLTVTNPTTTPALALGATLNWAALNKTGSSLADLATRTFASLTSIPSNVTNALSSLNDLSDLNSAETARNNLGGTTVGKNVFRLANPTAISFIKIAADNTVSTRTPSQVISDLALATVATTGAYSDLSGTPTSQSIASTSSVLKGDGSGNAVAATAKTDFWDTTTFGISGAGHAIGLVPDPGASAGSSKFLREDGTWQAGLGAGGVSAFSFTNGAGFVGTVVDGSDTPDLSLTLGDSADPTKTAIFSCSGITTATQRTITVPNANSTLVVADTGAANNFLTAISAAGAITKAQPAFTNLSGSVAATQMPALTGDVTSSAGAVATTIANDVVTFAKMQNTSAASVVIGRKTAGAGDLEELSYSDILDFVGTPTRGDILYRGAASWLRLGAGTTGHFLKTQGAGSDPLWDGALSLAGGTLTGDVVVSAATGPTNVASIGFRGSPVNEQNTAYTLVLADAGKTIYHSEATTARTYTIPANASVAFPIGTIITISNKNGSGSITLSITSDTLRRGDGTAGTGSRTIAANSVAAIQKMEATEWVIAGKFT